MYYLSRLLEKLHKHLRNVDVVLGYRDALQDKAPAGAGLLAHGGGLHLLREVGQDELAQALPVQVPDPVIAIQRHRQQAAVRVHRHQHGDRVAVRRPMLR